MSSVRTLSRSLAPFIGGLLLMVPMMARADYHIRSPNDIDQGEIEIEHNGAAVIDTDRSRDGARAYTAEIGYGVNSWWHPELELGMSREPGPGEHTKVDSVVWENVVRFTEPGEYWADLGFYAEYGVATLDKSADGVLWGPLIQKDVGRTTHTLNILFENQIGPNKDAQGTDLQYAWQSRWNLCQYASPAVEIYGDAGQIDRIPGFEQQQLLAGPVVLGSVALGLIGRLKYEVGTLAGLTHMSPDGAVRWRLEIERQF